MISCCIYIQFVFKVEEQGEQLNGSIRDANASCESWAQSCEKTIALPTLERFVEIEIETVTRKYDKLGRMVAEQIERLKIKVRETKAQEVSKNECGEIRC